MKVLKNYLWNVFYQFFLIIVPVATIPYVSRVLGPSGVGINSYTNSIVQYFILFGSIGVSFYGNRQIAYVRNDKKKLSDTFWSIFILRAFFITISLTAYMITALSYTKYTSFLLIQSILLVAAAFDISWFFMGIEMFRITVTRNILIKIISLISIFTFVKNSGDTAVYITIIALSTFFGNLTLFPYLRNRVGLPKIKLSDAFKHLLPSLSLFIPQIAIQIYVVLNKTMLGSMVSTDAAGFYDNSDKIVRILLAIVTSTGTVLLPHLANKFINGDQTAVKNIFAFSFDFVSFITVPLVFGLAAISNKFTFLYLGNKFIAVGTLIIIECLAALFISWNNAIGSQYLLPTKQNKSYTISVCVGAFVNIVLNFPLIIIGGAWGAMIATVISEMSVTISMLFSIRNQLSIKKLFSEFYKYFIAGFVMFIIIYYIDIHTSKNWNMLLFEVIIGVLVYIVVLKLTKPKIVSRIFNFIHKQL